MPTKRKPSKGTRDSSRQVKELRATVKQLRTRLERESRARKIEARLAVQTKKARAEVLKQLDSLRERGRKLAAQLKSALTDAGRREQARKEAIAKIAELRSELARRGEEVRRKSLELKNLAVESAERARAIITSQEGSAPGAAAPRQTPSRAATTELDAEEVPPPEKEWP